MITVIFSVFYFLSEDVHLTFPLLIFFCLSKIWSMLHHGTVERVQNKIKNTHIFSGTFLAVAVVFCNKIFVFIMIYALSMAYLLWAENFSLTVSFHLSQSNIKKKIIFFCFWFDCFIWLQINYILFKVPYEFKTITLKCLCRNSLWKMLIETGVLKYLKIC